MFVFDFADDFLDQVFDGDQALGARIFIDDNRQVHPRAAHFVEQLEHTHAFGYKARLTNEGVYALGLCAILCEHGEDILDVDHAGDLVERLVIDGEATMAVFGEGRDAIGKARGIGNRDNRAARNHHIINAVFAEMEQIAQHRALNRGQIAVGVGRNAAFGLFFMFGNRFFKLFAQSRLMIAAKDDRL